MDFWEAWTLDSHFSFALLLLVVNSVYENQHHSTPTTASNATATRTYETAPIEIVLQSHFLFLSSADEHHNADYDHDAFLGREEAQTFDELSPEESKERLGKIVAKIDKDGDGKVTEAELKVSARLRLCAEK